MRGPKTMKAFYGIGNFKKEEENQLEEKLAKAIK